VLLELLWVQKFHCWQFRQVVQALMLMQMKPKVPGSLPCSVQHCHQAAEEVLPVVHSMRLRG